MMKLQRMFLFLFLATMLLPPSVARAEEPLDEARIKELAAMLPEKAVGVGRPITDRQAWGAVARAPGFRDVVREAEAVLKSPIPAWSDELYLEFSQNGNRSRFQSLIGKRHKRLPILVIAECIEDRGRFLPAIEESIREICSEKTWVLPAHDRSLVNFKETSITIDLRAAAMGWEMATVDYWLAERLSDDVRQLIDDELERRIFGPYTGMITKGKPRMWWLKGTNNWNAVCLAGVTGTALGRIENRQRRAFFLAAAEKYVQYFLSGFTSDGYCSEGIGYWNYGFGHYVLLAETIHQSTGGKLDLMGPERIEPIARFGQRMEITPGLFPAFADCHVGSRPSEPLTAFLSRRYGWGLRDIEAKGLLLADGPMSSLFTQGVYGFDNSATAIPPRATDPEPVPLREWFPDAGILICRPAVGASLGAALKGGHNNEHHNHNDVGSFVVTRGSAMPLVDPGSEVYTSRTFSGRRYDSDVLNSLGHPVPKIDGKLQRTGRSAAAKLIESKFTDESDTLVLDIRAAYAVEELKKYQRSFVFSRLGAGSLIVIDEVELSEPKSFETALITFSSWRQIDPNRLLVGSGSEAVLVEIDADGNKFTVKAEKIEEDLGKHAKPTRLGIELVEPVQDVTVRMTITPVERGDK